MLITVFNKVDKAVNCLQQGPVFTKVDNADICLQQSR